MNSLTKTNPKPKPHTAVQKAWLLFIMVIGPIALVSLPGILVTHYFGKSPSPWLRFFTKSKAHTVAEDKSAAPPSASEQQLKARFSGTISGTNNSILKTSNPDTTYQIDGTDATGLTDHTDGIDLSSLNSPSSESKPNGAPNNPKIDLKSTSAPDLGSKFNNSQTGIQ